MSYRVFTSTWWHYEYRDGKRVRVPGSSGRKHTLEACVATEKEAVAMCRNWNATHDPGPLSRKAEYDEN